MKKCFKCGEVKPLNEFYKHHEMADGHLNKCKECNKKDAIATRNANIEYYREYDRKRASSPERVALRKKVERAWKQDGRRAESQKRYREKYPEKHKATTKIHNALRDGKIIKPNKCSKCGLKTSYLEAHHEDYSKPLNVQWLCLSCHVDTRRKYSRVKEQQTLYCILRK